MESSKKRPTNTISAPQSKPLHPYPSGAMLNICILPRWTTAGGHLGSLLSSPASQTYQTFPQKALASSVAAAPGQQQKSQTPVQRRQIWPLTLRLHVISCSSLQYSH